MTTITTEKIEYLKRLVKAATPGEWIRLFGERTVYDRLEDGCRGNAIVRADSPYPPRDAANLDFIAAFNPATASALLDLAQRAMLPQPQGRALPELPPLPEGWPNSHPYSYTADDMHDYARAYASQLALQAAQQLIGAGHFMMDKSGRWAEVDRNASNSTILYHGPEWTQENTDPFSHEERAAANVKYQMMKTSYEAEIKQLREQLALPAGPAPDVAAIRNAALEEAAKLAYEAVFTEIGARQAKELFLCIRALRSAPAVAQPVADEREGGA